MYRDLDSEELRPEESALISQVQRRDASIQRRTREIVQGVGSWALPLGRRGEKIGSKVEQDIERKAMFRIATAELEDPIVAAEQARRRIPTLLSEGYAAPESALTADDTIDYQRLPALLILGRKQDGMIVGKEL